MATKKKTDTTPDMRFSAPGANAPASLVAEVEVPIADGPLAGLKVTGVRVWRKKEDPAQLFVSFPAKSYEGSNGEAKFWEYLRASDGKGTTAQAVRDRILSAYEAQRKEVDPIQA